MSEGHMRETQRLADEAWEELDSMEMNDADYYKVMNRYLTLADEAREVRNREISKMFREAAEKTEKLENELAEVKAKLPADDPCDSEFMEEISS
jgi:rubrerythrin